MKKTYTIFYSWQTDTAGRERRMIGAALDNVCARVLRERGITLEMDESTIGESGMPSITETILRKIDKSDIFVCDLTPIIEFTKTIGGGQQETKQLPNSNVLVELGYAMSAIGLNYVIPLAHRGTWNANQLPFDINHHRIAVFTSSNIEGILYEAICNTLDYIKENGTHRHAETSYIVHAFNRTIAKIADHFTPKYDRNANEIRESTTVFFRERMCNAFSGKRGLVEYTKIRDIKRALTILLAQPLEFKYCSEDRDCDHQPIWWFERGSAMPITQFKHLRGRRFLVGMDECVIMRMVAYSDSGRYYGNYVYVEAEADKPTGLYKEHDKSFLERIRKEQYDYTEEFAVYTSFPFYKKKISRQEYDDGCFHFMGRVIPLHQKAELRCRHLKRHNFILTAKFSAFNIPAFDRTSHEMLDAVLRGEVNNEDFNKYMAKFPKPRYK